eukprot:gene12495-19333_t
MSKAPYLHPSQRNLRTEQVGPSSHQNEYHVGVLQGNWVEDRVMFSQKGSEAQNVKADCLTISRASYQKPAKGMKYRSDAVSQSETDRHLIFGHGNDLLQTNYTTMNDLTYTDISKPGTGTIKTETALQVQGNAQRSRLVEKKKSAWQTENDPEQDCFVTTKKHTHDWTGDTILKATAARRG